MSLVNRETDYAIRILRALSDYHPRTVATIAEEQKFAKSFAHKIVKKLEKSGFVTISKGPGGGIALNCVLSEKNLLDLMAAVNNVQYVSDCFKPGYQCECQKISNCKMHATFTQWQKHLDEQLKSIILDQLI